MTASGVSSGREPQDPEGLFSTEGRQVGRYSYRVQAVPERCPSWAPALGIGSDGWLPAIALGVMLRNHWDGPWKAVVIVGRNFRIPAERAVHVETFPDRQAAVAAALELDRRIAAGDIPGDSQG